jgi:hypothetical protein
MDACAVCDSTQAQGQWSLEVAGLEIGDELRLTNEVGDRLAAIGGDRQAELRLGRQVAELDDIVAVKQDDAVGQCLHGGDQPVGFGNPALDLSPQVLFVAVDTAENAIPGTQRLESWIGDRRPRPAIERAKLRNWKTSCSPRPPLKIAQPTQGATKWPSGQATTAASRMSNSERRR